MTIVRRLTPLIGSLLLALGLALAPTTAFASPVNPGGFCDADEVGQVKQATNNNWYKCTATSATTRHWKRTTTPAPTATATSGYGQPAPAATCTRPGYGAKVCNTPTAPTTPKASASVPAPARQLPVTSSTNGTLVAGAVVTGVLLTLGGAALFFLTRRVRRYRRGRAVA